MGLPSDVVNELIRVGHRELRANRKVVCHVSYQVCPRVHKLAVVQSQSADWLPICLSENRCFTHPFAHFALWATTFSPQNKAVFQEYVKTLEPIVDLWHCHNEPDYYPAWVREVSEKPIVWDIHDLGSLRSGKQEEDEANAFDVSDAFLTVPGPHLDAVLAVCEYKRPKLGAYRTLVPKVWFPPAVGTPTKKGLVMAAGLTEEAGNYKCWIHVFRKLHALGIPLTAYSGYNEIPESYRATGQTVLPSISPVDLLVEMSQYEAGFCGAPFDNPLRTAANPNKLYEYVAAGIPVVCVGKGLFMAKIIRDNAIGIVLSEPSSMLPRAIAEMQKLVDHAGQDIRARMASIREKFTMDEEVYHAYDIYGEIL